MENKNLKDKNIEEKTGIEYIRCADYYVPNLVMLCKNTNYTIGKYGRMKLKYLKNHKKAEYLHLLMEGNLNKYLHEIDIECKERINEIISKLAQQEHITEELKATNQIEWVQAMNNIKARAEELAFNEVIFELEEQV